MRPLFVVLALLLGAFAGWQGWTTPERHGLERASPPGPRGGPMGGIDAIRRHPEPSRIALEALEFARQGREAVEARGTPEPYWAELEDALEALDLADIEREWVEPTPESMRVWLEYRMEGIQRFVRDNGVERLAAYGWDREWPPVEGFLSAYDIDRLASSRLEAFSRAQRYKLFEQMVGEVHARSPLLHVHELRRTYRDLAERAWADVFSDAGEYPYDVVGLCYRVGLE